MITNAIILALLNFRILLRLQEYGVGASSDLARVDVGSVLPIHRLCLSGGFNKQQLAPDVRDCEMVTGARKFTVKYLLIFLYSWIDSMVVVKVPLWIYFTFDEMPWMCNLYRFVHSTNRAI
jgi:hypothetical protein